MISSDKFIMTKSTSTVFSDRAFEKAQSRTARCFSCIIISMRKITALICAAIAFAAEATGAERIATIGCGKQPKQVLFAPDGKSIVVPLLDDNGFDIISIEKGAAEKRISPPRAGRKGFAEGLFIPEKNAFFVSQMTTGEIHEFSLPDFGYRRTIKTGGTWSKVISWSAEKSLLAVSNWVSNDVSLIDYESGRVLRKIRTSAAPRGIAFTENGGAIVVLCFDGGKIQKFSTADGTKTAEISVEKAAMRHIVLGTDSNAFVTDMFHASVYEIDLKTLKIKRKTKVAKNPNTLARKGNILFVSCRGRNNPADYTKRSPENGKIVAIDTKTMEIAAEIPGGNQPTGLDISADGNTLCFSNFQDAAIELWDIADMDGK